MEWHKGIFFYLSEQILEVVEKAHALTQQENRKGYHQKKRKTKHLPYNTQRILQTLELKLFNQLIFGS